MSLIRVKTAGALAAAALLVALTGCQRADERVSAADRDLARSRPAQEAARRPAATPSPERQREAQQAPSSPGASPQAASTVGQRTPSAPGTPDTRAMGGPPSSGAQTMGAAARIDDASITRKVSAAIAADQQLRAIRIDVDTQNGIVTLSGPAPTATAKEHAGEVARTVNGVISVNNQLTLASG